MRWAREGAAVLMAGAAGTAVMDLGLAVERSARGGARAVGHPLDQDSSMAPVRAVENLTGVTFAPGARSAARWLLHWGYGSSVAVGRDLLRRRSVGEPAGTLTFFAATEAMAMSMFPATGATPPPWRWPRDVLATSLAAHLLYAAAVSAALPVTRRLTGAARPGRPAASAGRPRSASGSADA